MDEQHAGGETEWVSQRAARELLRGAGLTSRQARRLLGWGLAGLPLRTHAAHLYSRESVRRLAERRQVDPGVLAEQCPDGVFVARLGEAPMNGAQSLDARAAALARAEQGWEMALEQRTFLRIRVSRSRLPWVATVCGFVVAAAEVTELRLGASRNPAAAGDSLLVQSSHPRANGWCDGHRPTVMNVALVLEPAGAWAEHVRDRRFPTGPGPSWRFWQPPVG